MMGFWRGWRELKVAVLGEPGGGGYPSVLRTAPLGKGSSGGWGRELKVAALGDMGGGGLPLSPSDSSPWEGEQLGGGGAT